VLRRIFVPKRSEVREEWRGLHNKELYAVIPHRYFSSDQTKNCELGGTCSSYGEEERCIQGFGGET
jgi:hypothetical protein